MTEAELTFLGAGLLIGTTCGFLLAALMAASAQADDAVARAMREDADEIQHEAEDLNRGMPTNWERA